MDKLICNITGKEFYDIENRSGSITTHLKSLNIEIPSSYKRRQFLKENNTFWHSQFFKIEVIEDKEKFTCKYCKWDTVDLNNISGCYTTHLKKEHNKTVESYIKEFPEESIKFTTFLDKKSKENETSKKNNHVTCKICNKKLRYLTNTHLIKHNITPEEYKHKFGLSEYASKSFKEKTRTNLLIASKNIKKIFISKPEKDLQSFIEEDLNINILKNNRSFFDGVEIDIIIPEKNICFEFNGNLYHSENYGKKGKFFHLNKTEICKSKGYKLIHIMEDEWFLKNNIVKEKIKNILNISFKKSIYARKCTIREITSKEKNDFLDINHIQGQDKSNIYIGAFYENKLVSVMTLSSNIKANKNKMIYEIKRFASDINYNIVGIFSKFISFIKKNYELHELFTFLDLRWNSDEKENVYAKNGFKLSKIIKPDYMYYNSKVSRYKRFHKFGFSKNSLKNRFKEIYSDEKTEWEIMQELGYDRIWDCGKYKFYIDNINKC